MMLLIQWKNKRVLYSTTGFSLVELLVALTLFSFGLTALIRTHQTAQSTLQTSREHYNALLIVQECMEYAQVSGKLLFHQTTVVRNGISYFITGMSDNETNGIQTIAVTIQWKNKKLLFSNDLSVTKIQ